MKFDNIRKEQRPLILRGQRYFPIRNINNIQLQYILGVQILQVV